MNCLGCGAKLEGAESANCPKCGKPPKVTTAPGSDPADSDSFCSRGRRQLHPAYICVPLVVFISSFFPVWMVWSISDTGVTGRTGHFWKCVSTLPENLRAAPFWENLTRWHFANLIYLITAMIFGYEIGRLLLILIRRAATRSHRSYYFVAAALLISGWMSAVILENRHAQMPLLILSMVLGIAFVLRVYFDGKSLSKPAAQNTIENQSK